MTAYFTRVTSASSCYSGTLMLASSRPSPSTCKFTRKKSQASVFHKLFQITLTIWFWIIQLLFCLAHVWSHYASIQLLHESASISLTSTPSLTVWIIWKRNGRCRLEGRHAKTIPFSEKMHERLVSYPPTTFHMHLLALPVTLPGSGFFVLVVSYSNPGSCFFV